MQGLNELADRKQKQLKVFNDNKRKRNLILTKSVKESETIHSLIPGSILLTGMLKGKELENSLNLITNAIDGNLGFTIV